MKTKNIIKKLIQENDQDLKFKYNYQEVSKRLGFDSKDPINILNPQKYRNSFNFFKYASMVLLVISVSLGGLFIYYSSEKPTGDSLETNYSSEALVYQYFEDNQLKYIKSPIETKVINDYIVNVYLATTISDQIVFIFSFMDAPIEANMQINTDGFITSDSDLESESSKSDNIMSFYNENLNSFVTQEIKKEATYNLKIKYTIDDIEIEDSITLNIQEFLDYLE